MPDGDTENARDRRLDDLRRENAELREKAAKLEGRVTELLAPLTTGFD